MNPEEQRVAIAEACGWRVYDSNGLRYYERPGGNVWDYTLSVSGIPFYESELDAMHEAEETLTEPQREVYAWHLCCSKYDWYKQGEPAEREPRGYQWLEESPSDAFKTYHATAAQRAEAFIRTIGKWKDAK